MKKLLRKLVKSEKGLSLPIVLIVMAVGGMLIAPCLRYVDTSLIAIRTEQSKNRAIFAADAGIEDVMWSIKNGQTTQPNHLPQPINNLAVTMTTATQGTYVLFQGELIAGAGHCDYVLITSGNIGYDYTKLAYKYTITVTATDEATGQIKLEDVGAVLPVGYTYQNNSANLFADNLQTGEPTRSMLGSAQMVDWTWGNPGYDLSGTRTQEFLITGSGNLENYYAWGRAIRNDVDAVSEFEGDIYQITATAQGTNTVTTIKATVMKNGSDVQILSYIIS